ncbi:M4 family metallopeptidase [Glaciibacter flavus]|uniref:Neutral metalloproteinase n=1 Tax=Orlajensenia flava TaxID=2565934 RepID=A0A4V3WUE5_9MICO|nr:M4 family metallopeptidase [Glaciibacter flavus]THG35527.1 M4 family metallopeptidase [Glaciibacter flavus]
MTRGTHSPSHTCRIVPPYLLARIAEVDDPNWQHAAAAARASLLRDDPFRSIRAPEPHPHAPGVRTTTKPGAVANSPQRTVSTAAGVEKLPGKVVRREGDKPSSDVAVNEAYDGLGDTFELYWEAYHRSSIDGNGLPLNATVHYGKNYDNAFWDGERMVFGDGDGQVFNRFTIAVDVIGHELTHGVTEKTVGLQYEGQAGALNESISDVFGSLVAQYAKRQTAAQASWLIGEGLFTAEVQGVALRSMKAPGTAYDDDVLGKDPQPSHMSGYVETTDDNGGVHINSGIPNHAFYLAATAISGNAWERAGQIWYDTLLGGDVPSTATFAVFAAATVAAATARYGADDSATHDVDGAWRAVGVVPAG